MLEQTRGDVGPPTATMPAGDHLEERLAATGLAGPRDAAMGRHDRLVVARQSVTTVQAQIEQAGAAATASRAAVHCGEQAVSAFEREHRRLELALAGVDRLAASNGDRLDRTLLAALDELGAPEPLPAPERRKLLELASAEASAAVLRARLAAVVPVSALSAEEIARRLARAGEHLAAARTAAGEAFEHGQRVRQVADRASGRLEPFRDVGLSEDELDDVEALIAGDDEEAAEAVRAAKREAAGADRAVKRAEAELAWKRARAPAESAAS